MRTIYGLFIDGICHYVGQTKQPEQRKAAHAVTTMRGVPFEFRVLQVCSLSSSTKCELKWIKKYKAIGQAQRNINCGPSKSNKVLRIPVSLHRKLKLAAAIRGENLLTTIQVVIDAGLKAIENPLKKSK